jgi:cytoskeleton protein RodZ
VANAAPAANPNLLELTFNEQSWTEIFDANNQRVFVGLQTPGTTASVEGEPPFRLTVGNATGVELRYQGELVNLAERAGTNNVARFTLGE